MKTKALHRVYRLAHDLAAKGQGRVLDEARADAEAKMQRRQVQAGPVPSLPPGGALVELGDAEAGLGLAATGADGGFFEISGSDDQPNMGSWQASS